MGQFLLVEPEGQVNGTIINGAFTQTVLREAVLRNGKEPATFSVSYEGAEYRLFWNWLGKEQYQAIILGGGHISQPLAQVLAMMDFQVLIVDDRLEFANQGRFPWAKEVICAGFEQTLPKLEITENTAVIIVTRGHRHDMECLQGVLDSQAGYIGMIGSRRKVRGALAALEEAGFSRERLDRVYAPIGLDIGSQSPAEIAVSIGAEVLAILRQGSCIPLRDKERKQHG